MDSEASAFAASNTKHHRYMVFGKKQRYIEVFQCSGEDMSLVLTGGGAGQQKPPLLSPGIPVTPPQNPHLQHAGMVAQYDQAALLAAAAGLPQLQHVPLLPPQHVPPQHLLLPGIVPGLLPQPPQLHPQLLMLPPQPRLLFPQPRPSAPLTLPGLKRTHEQAFLPGQAYPPNLPPKRPPVMYSVAGAGPLLPPPPTLSAPPTPPYQPV